MERRNAWHEYTEEQLREVEELSTAYRHFLDHGKTERECVDQIVAAAEAAGYRNMDTVIKEGATLQAGDKVYYVHMKKAVAMVNIGTEPIEQGMNILGAHIDSPRLDVKQNPFYVDSDLALLDTHYYGGIKKYQWVTMPRIFRQSNRAKTTCPICKEPLHLDPIVGVVKHRFLSIGACQEHGTFGVHWYVGKSTSKHLGKRYFVSKMVTNAPLGLRELYARKR